MTTPAIEPSSIIELAIEKPAAGGRMLARHHGQIALVAGAIPGERVHARIERVAKGVLYAETTEVVSPSADRRDSPPDWRCGGNVLAHVVYSRQLRLKAEIIQDAFTRIAHLPLAAAPIVVGSSERGYRMRARLHAAEGRLGFYREGTHRLCDPAVSGQLLPATTAWIATVEETILRHRLDGLVGMEIAENIAGDERACHLELRAGADVAAFNVLSSSSGNGLSAQRADRMNVVVLAGQPVVADTLRLSDDQSAPTVRLRRNVRSFFQGNRFLLERLVRHVTGLVPGGPVVDLYAGVGLFGLSLAAIGIDEVVLVESNPVSGSDLQTNAAPWSESASVHRGSVEGFLRSDRIPSGATFVVDPPRTGLSKEALASVIANKPRRLIYVACDVATLARDTRAFVNAGYEVQDLTAFDLFPNTAHIESVVVLARSG